MMASNHQRLRLIPMVVLVVVLLPLVLFAVISTAVPNTNQVYKVFGYEDPNPVSEYQDYARHVRQKLIKDTPTNGFSYYLSIEREVKCYGHAACRVGSPGISSEDCSVCLEAAQVHWLQGQTMQYFNGIIKLEDCKMRWAPDPVNDLY